MGNYEVIYDGDYFQVVWFYLLCQQCGSCALLYGSCGVCRYRYH
jgi:hypothetical protein